MSKADVPRLMPYLALYTLLTRHTGRDSPLSISLYWVLLFSVSKFWPSKQYRRVPAVNRQGEMSTG